MSGTVAIASALAILSGSVATKDNLCGRLDRFERGVVHSKASSASIKMMYDWGNWTVLCASREPPGKKLCSWLPRHSSMEFPQILIKRVFACRTGVWFRERTFNP